ncbi:hypothetical protein GP475_04710 [Corynebacterium poyangense]|uniref:Uncharacterized protein n=1 Tax=Corynebacterium poyangense TaxID=2684405 RepID=A0A7H0SS80_9CORY|nr:hypothetical protein [Corynebacterium poyangense]QNQ91405.1 hypothetical protein GP475_04710 [Corynebacterium poyangense]
MCRASTPLQLAGQLSDLAPLVIQKFTSILRHPRSLARPTALWRPPILQLAARGYPDLQATVTRYRVGPKTRARVRGFGEARVPAYLVVLRLSRPDAQAVSHPLAKGWIRALVGAGRAEAVHELSDSHTPMYCWLIDANFEPVHSPASLFSHFLEAA